MSRISSLNGDKEKFQKKLKDTANVQEGPSEKRKARKISKDNAEGVNHAVSDGGDDDNNGNEPKFKMEPEPLILVMVKHWAPEGYYHVREVSFCSI